MSANKVSHSNIKTRTYKAANVQKRKVYDPDSKRTLTLYLTARSLRTLDKLGLSGFVRKFGVADERVTRALA
jgi:ribosomal protein L28